MIKKLNELDRDFVLEYLYKEPSYNIFPIGDIETFGFDKDFQTVYGDIDESGNYESILLIYRKNIIYYSHKAVFNKEWLDFIDSKKCSFISGKMELMDLISPYIETRFKHRSFYFCKATSLKVDSDIDETDIKLLETEEDCAVLYDLLKTIDEFSYSKKESKESFIQSKMDSKAMSITLFMVENGIATSTVATTAETTKSAMIVGVATHKQHRHQGLASTLMISLMKRYFEKGKELCLFYDNPAAGKIYLRLGFEYMGMWGLFERKYK